MPPTRFATIARRRQAMFRDTSPTISAACRRPSDDKGRRHGHLLALGCEDENLYPPLRGPDGARQFFADRAIKWWRSSRSGDPKGSDGPTRNLASSQIACVNYLLPLAEHPDALLTILRTLDDDAREVAPLEYNVRKSKRSVRALFEFEWIGLRSSLEGRRYTRGANVTSADALMVADLDGGGRRGYLFEWKYAEEYRKADDKGAGKQGETRLKRYRDRYLAPPSPFRSEIPVQELLWDPFYQLMRLGLLGAKMLEEKEFGVSEIRLVVVCPRENLEYRNTVTSPGLKRRFAGRDSMTDVFNAACRDPSFLRTTAPQDLLRAVSAAHSGSLGDWIDYQRARYGDTE